MLTSLAFAVMCYYATGPGRLLRHAPDLHYRRGGLLQSAAAPVLYLCAALLAFAWPSGTILIQILVLLMFALRSPGRVRHPLSS